MPCMQYLYCDLQVNRCLCMPSIFCSLCCSCLRAVHELQAPSQIKKVTPPPFPLSIPRRSTSLSSLVLQHFVVPFAEARKLAEQQIHRVRLLLEHSVC